MQFDIVKEVNNKYSSIMLKSMKIINEHWNNSEIRIVLSVIVGSTSSIAILTKISIPVTLEEQQLFKQLNLKGITFSSTQVSSSATDNIPVIDLEYAYSFLDTVDKSLDFIDNLSTVKVWIEREFEKNKIHKIWTN